MYRAMTYGPKYTGWFTCHHDMGTYANRLWGPGMWTWEWRPKGHPDTRA